MSLTELYGPRTEFGQKIHSVKYRHPDETFDDYCVRYSRTVADDEKSFRRALSYTRSQAWLPAGRQQLSVGRPFQTTAFNCFAGDVIDDSIDGIFDSLKRGMLTLRSGGGDGWNFSTLRPRGEPIRGLGHGAFASGPLSFMGSWNQGCETILSAGHRRGAMMGILNVDHPDILDFIRVKQDGITLKNFNISVGATREFMEALDSDGLYWLQFNGMKFRQVRAVDVWAVIMESNWDWAEPGIIFLDRINERNPLYYCERIWTTNPCGEQPLPPHGACLLGSVNMLKMLRPIHQRVEVRNLKGMMLRGYEIDWELLDDVVDCAVRANDNVIDRTIYPLEEQKIEAQQKRRMGIGWTGMANALEVLGFPYGTPGYIEKQEEIGQRIVNQAYLSSIELAKEKGAFPLFDAEKYCEGWFINNRLPEDIKEQVRIHGLRNGLLTSQAPTGTISMVADNVSSGVEPPFSMNTKYKIFMPGEGQVTLEAEDHASAFFGVKGRIANDVSAEEHVDVLCSAQKVTDSSVSKTCNVFGQIGGEGEGMTFNDFKKLYIRAYLGGAKGCTTFNLNGKREGVRESADPNPAEKAFVSEDGLACAYDPATGIRSCEA